MNCENLACTNGQQAPTGWPALSARQSVRFEPVHTASTNRNFTVGTTVKYSSSAPTIVSRMLVGELNSLCRISPITPGRFTGGGRCGTISPRTNTGVTDPSSLMRPCSG
ncbi:hypothetical protein LOC51_31525 [Rubrivivax sp. JA1024]|nr:hypothetical protein [Rubrivivax sp. JA1024]